jgi:peptidoglycan/xylan/chitin deacetylase (PgdA/CDA1 family)
MRRAPSRVPILAYHLVSSTSVPAFARYTVTPRAFAAQMRWLAMARYTPIPMATLASCWREHRMPPRRAVVITFDDGFRDCIEFALPVLRRHRFPAVFYLVAGLVGQTSRWMAHPAGELPLFDWTAARALQTAGMQCGAHSMSHLALGECPASETRRELIESRKLLEDRLGCAVQHLAYPYGSVTRAVRDLSEEAGYLSACTTEKRLAAAADDPLLLPRVTIYGGESLLDFVCRLRTALTPRQLLRRKMPRFARIPRAGTRCG